MKNIYIAAISLILLIGMAAAETKTLADWTIVGQSQLAQNYIGGHTFDTFQMNVLGTTDGFAGTTAVPNTVAGQSGINAIGQVKFSNIGTTDFVENMVEGGLNWQNPGSGWTLASPPDVATAYIKERITNTATLNVDKQFQNPFDWKLGETKAVDGTGATTIMKEVGFWTNAQGGDATQVQVGITFEVPLDGVDMTDGLLATDGRGAQPGLSTFPAVSNIYTLCPYTFPSQSGINTYAWSGSTDNPFTFSENVWINGYLS